MSDPGRAINILAARLSLASENEYTTIRQYLSDWPRTRKHMKQCQNCQDGYGDDEMDGEYVDTAVWWCWRCVKSTTPAEREEQFGMSHLFETFWKVGE